MRPVGPVMWTRNWTSKPSLRTASAGDETLLRYLGTPRIWISGDKGGSRYFGIVARRTGSVAGLPSMCNYSAQALVQAVVVMISNEAVDIGLMRLTGLVPLGVTCVNRPVWCPVAVWPLLIAGWLKEVGEEVGIWVFIKWQIHWLFGSTVWVRAFVLVVHTCVYVLVHASVAPIEIVSVDW